VRDERNRRERDMTELDAILDDLKKLAPVMTTEEFDVSTSAVVESQYHAKALVKCMDRITAVIEAVVERRK
jgi:hypothetical protein